MATLSGSSHAEEVARGAPTGLLLSGGLAALRPSARARKTVFEEVRIVRDAFAAIFGKHDFKGDAVSEAQATLPRLPRPCGTALMQALIDPDDFTSHQQGCQSIFHGIPAQPRLYKGP